MALIRVLLILSRSGEEGLPAVTLLEKLKSTNYGQRMIKLGEKKGYIERINVKVPGGKKGNVYVINKLTPKGRCKTKRN